MRIATASTMVRKPPTLAPSGSSRGRPLSSTPTSVVVPPISATTASSTPARRRAPTRLAAGPDRMVSIGRALAKAAVTSAPSPRTTIRGAATPRFARNPSVAVTSRSIIEIRRALSSVVRARLGPPSLAVSSWLIVTGRPARSRTRSRTAISWAGLRTAKWPQTANAQTLSLSAGSAASSPSRTSGLSPPKTS